MMKTHSNHFQFVNSENAAGLTVLNAVMSDFYYSNHAHDDFALGVTLEGVQEFVCNGQKIQSSPGNVILLNPGDVHDGNPGKDTVLKYTILYIDSDEFSPLLGSAAMDKKDFRIPEMHFEDRVLRSLILEMSHFVTKADGKSAFEYEHCLYKIATRLTQRLGIFHPGAWRGHKDTLLLKACEYIHDNIEMDISINDLSRVTNISKFHFIRLFRRQFGLTPHQYIINHKVNRARLELKTGEPPSEVAQRFGFFDVSHMNRHFKRSYGITPRQYQHQLLKG